MNDAIRDVVGSIDPRQGASAVEIEGLDLQLNIRLPSEYKNFLTFNNGFEGILSGGNYLAIWPCGEALEFNKDSGVSEFAPGLFVFGSDRGGTGYGLDTRDNSWRVYTIQMDSMCWDDAIQVANSFDEFLGFNFETKSTKKA